MTFSYIFPSSLRRRMSRLWGVDVTHWWLPNEEDYPPILQATREFIKDRTAAPKDPFGQDVRDINGIFSTLNIDDPDQIGESGSQQQTPEDTTGQQALAAMDQINLQQMPSDFDDQSMGDDSVPPYLQEMAAAPPPWSVQQ
jgi:hypothetical protein